jgi:release factor glutamine methyltransferase
VTLLKLGDYLRLAEQELRDGPHENRARLDAETLLGHMLGRDRAWLLAHRDADLDRHQLAAYKEFLDRRTVGEPIQYIIGETEFYGLPFRVTPDVLIPRPETEHLVEQCLALATPSGAPSFRRSLPEGWESTSPAPPIRILDVGTGSGVIAISLARKLPQAQITATDITTSALTVAQENAKRNGVAIRFLEGDLLAPVAGESFDIIVSNPPYVADSDRDSLSVEVRDHEPALALFAGIDGLEIYRRLIPAAFAALIPTGFIALEIGFGQQPAINSLLIEAGFSDTQFIPDLQSIPRVAVARRL